MRHYARLFLNMRAYGREREFLKGRKMVTENEKLVDAAIMGEMVSMKPDTVRRLARKGIIPSIRVTPKILRFDPKVVIKVLGSGKSSDIPGSTQKE
jgi:hypothetical protein